jgi:hypothetical protein
MLFTRGGSMYGGSRVTLLCAGLGLCLAISACAAQASADAGGKAAAHAALTVAKHGGAPAVGRAPAPGRVPAVGRAPAPGREPAEFFGTWLVPDQAVTVAAFSAATGRRLRILAPPEPGGGDSGLALAPGGRTLAFAAGNGTCGSLIESVATAGGPVRVLVPDRPQHGGMPASAPSYSADGRYLSYGTVYCSGLTEHLNLENLRTGMVRVQRTGFGQFGLVFIRDDHLAVAAAGAHLAVASLPSLTVRTYPAPAGCSLDSVAGTESRLVATLDCGPRHLLSVVSLSTRTFRVTGTLARLGRCLQAGSISLAGDDAVLVEATRGCDVRPTAIPSAEIVAIRGGHARTILAGKIDALPGDVVW